MRESEREIMKERERKTDAGTRKAKIYRNGAYERQRKQDSAIIRTIKMKENINIVH